MAAQPASDSSPGSRPVSIASTCPSLRWRRDRQPRDRIATILFYRGELSTLVVENADHVRALKHLPDCCARAVAVYDGGPRTDEVRFS